MEVQQTTKTFKIIKTLLILASILATVKMIFADYTLDEEYQIVMAYRSLSGDVLFGTMWEPHQTSAFVCVWLMRLFQMVTGGTTGVVLFLRFVTTEIQLALACWVTGALRKIIGKEYAFLLGCCYFNMVPKAIQIPEFSNLQLWFLTVTVLALMHAFDMAETEQIGRHRSGWIILAGIGMAGEVLAYPACLILFFFFLFVIFRHSGWRESALFAATCAGCAAVWLAAVLAKVSLSEFLRNVSYVLNFDLTHDVSLAADYRTDALRLGAATSVFPILATGLLGVGMWFGYRLMRKADVDKTIPVFAVFLVLAAELVQLFYWIVLRKGYEEPLLYLAVLFLAAALVWRQADSRKTGLAPGIWAGFLALAAGIYMSDLVAWYAIPHGLLGALFAAAVLVIALEKQGREKSRKWILLLLVSLSFCIVFGKGFTLRAGNTDTNTVLGIRGVIRKGPAAGIFTNYMQAYITNCTYDDFADCVEPGENCLIVTNMVGTAGTSPYLFQNNKVSHFSIVDPTSYDERLLTYWALYPEKYPEVIIVDCWYGQLMEREDSWIMQYIENEFGYTQVEDGRYVRFYRRKERGTEE